MPDDRMFTDAEALLVTRNARILSTRAALCSTTCDE